MRRRNLDGPIFFSHPMSTYPSYDESGRIGLQQRSQAVSVCLRSVQRTRPRRGRARHGNRGNVRVGAPHLSVHGKADGGNCRWTIAPASSNGHSCPSEEPPLSSHDRHCVTVRSRDEVPHFPPWPRRAALPARYFRQKAPAARLFALARPTRPNKSRCCPKCTRAVSTYREPSHTILPVAHET